MTEPNRGRGDPHAEYRLLAAAAVDGRLDPDSAAALEAHLASCAACRADLDGMLADHAWLAAPAEPVLPPAHVRQAIVEAARSHRVPQLGSPRPWGALLAVALVISVIGGGVLLANLGPSRPPNGAAASQPVTSAVAGSPTLPPVPSAAPSRLPTMVPTAIARGHFAPDNDIASGALDVDIQLIGRIENGGTAIINVVGPFGETWTGRATSTQFWMDTNGSRPVYVAYIEGCKTGTSCEAFHIMLVDGRDVDGIDRIEIDFYPSLEELDPQRPHPWFRRTSGTLEVVGPIPAA